MHQHEIWIYDDCVVQNRLLNHRPARAWKQNRYSNGTVTTKIDADFADVKAVVLVGRVGVGVKHALWIF